MAPHTKLTVDVIIFVMKEGALNVLLVKRAHEPYIGKWAIPGGFVRYGEALEDAALRELREETGVKNVYLEQLYTFGKPGRDPRGHVVTVAYFALLSAEVEIEAGSDASNAEWFKITKLPPLAFDHHSILTYAIERLRNKLEYTTAGFKLLPEKFTLSELQRVYECVLDKKLDKRNFRRKVLLLKVLDPLNEWKREGMSRPAQLFRFSQKRFEKLKDKGILFPF